MYWRKEMIQVNDTLFVVQRRFKMETFQKVMDSFPAQEICEGYHCDKLLKGNDGFVYLVDVVNNIECEMI